MPPAATAENHVIALKETTFGMSNPRIGFGWCFQWDHDGTWELEHATLSFDATLKALTDGIEKRDAAMLSFLGIYID
ncbi:MAG: hypothetical protein JWQ17_4728 [Tardiphaga sp.]|jgi:hypothetical protein|nr:hypothetical protein [Tardiphaga sp.]